MKRISLLVILGILIASCSSGGGGGDDDPVDPPKENQPPSAVESLTYPTNNLLCTTNVLEFKWAAATDPDGDAVSYVLEISKKNDFSAIEESITVSGTSRTVTLEKGVAYYWRVKAVDSKNASSAYSSTYQFYTEGEGETNHLPFSPELVAPQLDAALNTASTTLEWDASDVDNDPLTYDVYFDTNSDPTTKVGDNQSDKTLSVNLSAATTYYWKVVVKDDKGGQAIGQVWSFTTD
ncbi:SusE domain-containing protein [Seonamhaeicola sp.]|uniref:SusE domain-containing protein n=1 Tax=Seonamhaeicola sp. TaxID=1912245 RepID=UPI00260D234C|nr:SusE domain-containing protein [Seonamhaeicola sp.]